MDCGIPGLPVHHQLLEPTQTHVHRGFHPAILSSVVPFSSCPQSLPASGSFPMSQLIELKCFSCVRLFETLWTIVRQAPLSMRFSSQEYWSGLSYPSPGDLSNPGTEPISLTSPALAGGFFTAKPPSRLSQVCDHI